MLEICVVGISVFRISGESVKKLIVFVCICESMLVLVFNWLLG